jgi:PAS domain S-box-containing protein
VMQAVGEGIIICDKYGKFILFNKKAEEIIGKGSLDITPEQWPTTYGVYHLDGKQLFKVDELLMIRALNGETVEHAEMLIIHPELKTEKRLVASARPVRDANDQITAAIVDFKDVSEIKHLESLLNDIRDKYDQLVTDRKKS